MDIKNFDKNDWDHFYGVILDVTYNTSKVKSNQQEMEKLFLELPEEMIEEAYKYGMSDTCWRDGLWEWYEENKMNK